VLGFASTIATRDLKVKVWRCVDPADAHAIQENAERTKDTRIASASNDGFSPAGPQ
jgi:hypothetical protein